MMLDICGDSDDDGDIEFQYMIVGDFRVLICVLVVVFKNGNDHDHPDIYQLTRGNCVEIGDR